MQCVIENCRRTVRYKDRGICQMHYFRFMRNGSYDLKTERRPSPKRPRKDRYVDPKGYVVVWAEGHPLANKRGLVRENRRVYHDEVDSSPTSCLLCSEPINWKTLHIDHIDNNTGNNDKHNLRALCRSCNVFRGHTAESMGKHILEVDGVRMDAMAWARCAGVELSGHTILCRFKGGMSAKDAIFSPRKTHQNTRTKKPKTKYDDVRGLPQPGDFDVLRAELPCNKVKVT